MAMAVKKGELELAIEQAITDAANREVDLILSASQDRVKAELRKRVAKIVMSIMSEYNVERKGNMLSIKVKMPE